MRTCSVYKHSLKQRTENTICIGTSCREVAKYLDDLDVLIRIGVEFRSLYTEEAKAAGKLVFERYMPFLLGGG